MKWRNSLKKYTLLKQSQGETANLESSRTLKKLNQKFKKSSYKENSRSKRFSKFYQTVKKQ